MPEQEKTTHTNAAPKPTYRILQRSENLKIILS